MATCPPDFRVLPCRHQRADGAWRVDFDIRARDARQIVTYDFPASSGEPETDGAVVPIGLFAEMGHRLPFAVEKPIDERLAEDARIAMDPAAESWARDLVAVPLHLPIRSTTPARPGGGGEGVLRA